MVSAAVVADPFGHYDERVLRDAFPDLVTAALRQLGGLDQRKEACRDERQVAIVENLGRDLRLAVRQLRGQPGFAIAAIASLALGLGANAAIFHLLNAVSFRPLPVSAPHQLVEVRLEGEGRAGRHTGRNRQWSLPQWMELQRRQGAFTSMFAFGDTRFNLATTGEVRNVEGVWVSGSYFDVLGIAPALGRLIGPDDDRPGCGFPGAVISHALWQREFGGRADVLSQTIPFDQTRVPILGVTPPTFSGVEVGRRFDVALPICSASADRRDHWWLAAIGRLRPGWTAAQAQAHLQGQLEGLQRDVMPVEYTPEEMVTYRAMRVAVVDASTGVSPLRQSYRQPLWILLAIAGLLLLIASVNLANLLLARATARQQEFALRLAIGGSRGRVLQQVLIESLLIATLGSLAAVVVATAVSRSLLRLISTTLNPIHLDLSIDWRFVAFIVATALTTSMIFGMAPALRAARATALQPGRRGTSASRSVLAVRRGLVALQCSVTLVLLVGALLFVRSFTNLATQDLGVRPDGVVVAHVLFPEAAFPPEKRPLAFADLDQRLRALPAVRAATDASTTPLGGNFSDRQIRVDGQRQSESSYVNWVGPGYFDALGTPIVAGRDIGAEDSPTSPKVALVNQRFAERFLGGDAVGRYFGSVNIAGVPDTIYLVIGVVRNQTYLDIREAQPPIFYPASAQEPLGLTRRYVLRSSEPPSRLVPAISDVLRQVDPAITVRYATLRTQVDDAVIQESLLARLAGIFGLVALVLAMVGLYGVVAYSVASRRGEIGVRVALGATRTTVLALILGDVGRMLVAGTAVGSLAGYLAFRGVRSLLYGLEPGDPISLAAAAGLLVGAGLLAAAWPAARATRIDPAEALRQE